MPRRVPISALLALAHLACSPVNCQPVTAPPDLIPGAQYRLVFISSGTRDGTSEAIADYNAFVDAEASSVPELNALGTAWTALASTAATDAKINTATNDAPAGPTGVPIYRLDGTRVADHYDDLWDASLLAAIEIDSSGSQGLNDYVWTGTKSNGLRHTGNPGDDPLGDSTPGVGCPSATGFGWINDGNGFHLDSSGAWSLYGISGVLTVLEDTTPPTLGVSLPSNPFVTDDSALTMNGTAFDPSGVASVTVNGIPVSTTDGFATWSATVDPLTPGNNLLTIVATDGAAAGNQTTIGQVVHYATNDLDTDLDGMSDRWELENGLDLFDDGSVLTVNGPSGDGDLDQIDNLAEFALAQDPNLSDPSPLESASQVNPIDGKTYATLQFRRRISAPTILIEPLTSPDLIVWDEAPTNTEEVSVTPHPDGISETVVLRLLPALEDGTTRLFGRLRITAVGTP